MGPPQVAQVHSPVNLGFSPGVDGAVVSSPAKASSGGIGSLAGSVSSKSGTSSAGMGSSAVGIAGSAAAAFSFSLLLAKHARHVSPFSLRGWNGNWVIAPPQLLQVQFPSYIISQSLFASDEQYTIVSPRKSGIFLTRLEVSDLVLGNGNIET